ncbi:hypothetical protein HDU76_009900 [Blyttiomyces sp. JEL0837]|nr:hypothetical protein HDU76_009900 [Blyttiomyces sp. JEL0837]
MTHLERRQLFTSLDADGDGVLRWPEIAGPHIWMTQDPSDVFRYDGRVMGGSAGSFRMGVDWRQVGRDPMPKDPLNPSGVAIWELAWLAEVWRRVKALKSANVPGSKEEAYIESLFGTGLDRRPAVNRF